MRAIAGAMAGWSQEHELLASIYDSLRAQLWQAGGKSSAPRPKPFPRPGARSEVHRTSLTPKQIHARLLAQQARRSKEIADGWC